MEYFDIVDEKDNVIGKASRQECHEKGLTHRAVQFFIFDQQDRILVNKRSSTKEFFEGQWSIVLGGHVTSGDDYETTVRREVLEEVGITSEPFFMGEFKKFIPEEKEIVKVYGFKTDGMVTLLEDEIEFGEFQTFEEMIETLGKNEFIPETKYLLEILTKYFDGN